VCGNAPLPFELQERRAINVEFPLPPPTNQPVRWREFDSTGPGISSGCGNVPCFALYAAPGALSAPQSQQIDLYAGENLTGNAPVVGTRCRKASLHRLQSLQIYCVGTPSVKASSFRLQEPCQWAPGLRVTALTTGSHDLAVGAPLVSCTSGQLPFLGAPFVMSGVRAGSCSVCGSYLHCFMLHV
jgi:hypothetical protein